MRKKGATTVGWLTVGLALVATPAVAGGLHLGFESGPSGASQTAAADGGAAPLSAVDQIVGRKLVNTDGAKIGTIEDVVRLKADNTPYAIVSVKWSGQSNKDITIRYSDIKLMPEEVMIQTHLTARDYATMPSYNSSEYVPLDQPAAG